MGACCGKPDRKNQGYVLGGSNTSSNASAPGHGVEASRPAGTATAAGQAGKAKAQQQQNGGAPAQTLGGTPAPRTQGELSASALAAQKRAEAADKRGVKQGGGQLAKKLADQKKQSPYAVEEQLPEPTNTQWN